MNKKGQEERQGEHDHPFTGQFQGCRPCKCLCLAHPSGLPKIKIQIEIAIEIQLQTQIVPSG